MLHNCSGECPRGMCGRELPGNIRGKCADTLHLTWSPFLLRAKVMSGISLAVISLSSFYFPGRGRREGDRGGRITGRKRGERKGVGRKEESLTDILNRFK